MSMTLISALLGILSSILPNVIQYFQRKQEIKYELELAGLKINAALQGIKLETERAEIVAGYEEGKDVRAHDLGIDESGPLAVFRASVRPTITYAFFIMFVSVKFLTAVVVIRQGGLNIANMQTFTTIMFDDSTLAIFGTLIGFWFGTRSITKLTAVIPQNSAVSELIPDTSNKKK